MTALLAAALLATAAPAPFRTASATATPTAPPTTIQSASTGQTPPSAPAAPAEPGVRGARQLTFPDRFLKAGEAYFSPDGRRIVFQAIEVPAEGAEPDEFYAMFVCEVVRDPAGEIVGVENIRRISPKWSARSAVRKCWRAACWLGSTKRSTARSCWGR